MEIILLTKSTTPIIGFVADILGYIMDFIFRLTNNFGVINIGLGIIIFTILVNLIMLPLTIKQQKSSKLMSVMQPEIQAIQKKYKGKTDNDSMMRLNAETKAVYEKYGTSMTGGCVQMAIQMPILFALYQVIYRIPAYVPIVRVYYEKIANSIMQQNDYINSISSVATDLKMPIDKIDYTSINKVIDLLYKFTPSNWENLKEIFPSISTVVAENAIVIEKMNSFLGMNLSVSPFNGSFIPTIAWIIPILAGVTQWYSTKLMTATQASPNGDENAMAQQMKTMNNVMPLMSVMFCFTFPAGIGLYWIASSVCRIIQQIAINKHLDKIDIEQLVEENIKKANEKRAKKGLPPQSINKNAIINAKNLENKIADEENKLKNKIEMAAKQAKDSTEYYNKNAKPGSLASKANMVSQYNEKVNNKK